MLHSYSSSDQALKNDYAVSPWYQLLNRGWKFSYSESPEKSPVVFYKVDVSEAVWKNIPVSGNRELNGVGLPIYTNVIFPFPKSPSFTAFSLHPLELTENRLWVPENWDGKNIIIHFGFVTRVCTCIEMANRWPLQKPVKRGLNLILQNF